MEQSKLPLHIGIIMDGNGRWAKKKGLPRFAGHNAGAIAFYKIVKYCSEIGIKHLTVYAFSTENWKRSQKEIETIMKLMQSYINDIEKYLKLNVRPIFIGDLSVFDPETVRKMNDIQKRGEELTGMILNIAINYGGKNEIINATKQIVAEVNQNKFDINNLDEQTFSEYLYTKNQPDVDLLIRPSGEQRLSNFLIWQCAYAEFVFMDVLWPDFNSRHLDNAIEEFNNRNRRFGG